jgi:hypothetical protein
MRPMSRIDRTALLKLADEEGRVFPGSERQVSKAPRSRGAIAALTQDLAAMRGELIRMRTENTRLRQRLGSAPAREGARTSRVGSRSRESEILAMVREQQAIGRRKTRTRSVTHKFDFRGGRAR